MEHCSTWAYLDYRREENIKVRRNENHTFTISLTLFAEIHQTDMYSITRDEEGTLVAREGWESREVSEKEAEEIHTKYRHFMEFDTAILCEEWCKRFSADEMIWGFKYLKHRESITSPKFIAPTTLEFIIPDRDPMNNIPFTEESVVECFMNDRLEDLFYSIGFTLNLWIVPDTFYHYIKKD